MQKKSLAQKTADDLYKMIAGNEQYFPGDQLPGENALCLELGVSRATLREAIHILVSQGILEVYRGKGTFITQNASIFSDLSTKSFDRERLQINDLFEARLMFEPEIAAIACQRATEEELERILRLGKAVERTILAGQDRTEIDQEFHCAIVSASHNVFLMRLIPIINRGVQESVRLFLGTPSLAEDTLRDHAVIMDFLRRRDSAGARHAMAIHIHRAICNMGLNIGNNPIL